MKSIKSMKKQYLVIGLGRFGSSVARSLSEMGHEVLAMDVNQDFVDNVAPYVTQAVCADAADEEVLKSVDPSGFDAAIVSIGQDTRGSILITVLCKEMGVPLVVAKAQDELHGKVLAKVGADKVIYPERDMGRRLARSLSMNRFIDMMELTDHYEMVECNLPTGWKGKTIAELNVRRNYGVNITAIKRNDSFIPSPSAEERFCEDDILLIMGLDENIEKLMER